MVFSAQSFNFTDCLNRDKFPKPSCESPLLFKWELVAGIARQNRRPSCNLRKSHLVRGTLKQQDVIIVNQTSFAIALNFYGS